MKQLRRVGRVNSVRNTVFVATSAQSRDLIGFSFEEEGFKYYSKSFKVNGVLVEKPLSSAELKRICQQHLMD